MMTRIILLAALSTCCGQIKWLPPHNAVLLARASHSGSLMPTKTTMGEPIEVRRDDTLVFLDDDGSRTPERSYRGFEIEGDVLWAVTEDEQRTRVPLDDLAAIGVVDYSKTPLVVGGIVLGVAAVVGMVVAGIAASGVSDMKMCIFGCGP